MKPQHTQPCRDCPWRRCSVRGWLGEIPAQAWLAWAGEETLIDCHTRSTHQCAGLAIFRANIFKLPRSPLILVLPPDPVKVFSTREGFLSHHTLP